MNFLVLFSVKMTNLTIFFNQKKVGGGILIGFGVYASKAESGVSQLFSLALAIGLIVVGSFVLLTSCFGCFGAWRESRCFLGMYFVILLVLIIVQVSIGAAGFALRGRAQQELQNAWEKSADSVRNEIQQHFNCCGWANTTDNPGTNCSQPNEGECATIVVQYVQDKTTVIAITGIVVGSVEVFGLIFSLCLMCSIPSEAQKREALLRQARDSNKSYQGNR